MRKFLVFALLTMSVAFAGCGVVKDMTTETKEIDHIKETCEEVIVEETILEEEIIEEVYIS